MQVSLDKCGVSYFTHAYLEIMSFIVELINQIHNWQKVIRLIKINYSKHGKSLKPADLQYFFEEKRARNWQIKENIMP